ncbi:beta-lactamase domain-containing protein [Corynebacterium maris DSM 45190]|uniref:Beta-lactamase domain-containing protein n=1 Tax=Corynebacterium maris DSM 45190 TaxID=1224163 RepID=S5TKX5_9CORY|nr:N-acyl homoserine lactonase family protein [Corynebacterium maris]AGS35358.1 beta-lactamase domain-containing protein [Corynebacterium maris DSM 45190]
MTTVSPTPTSVKTTAKTLYGLDSPTMTIDSAHMVNGMSGEVKIPLPAYLIEHEQGLVLFDTGFHPKVCDGPANLFGDRPETDMIESRPEHKLEHQLAKLGYSLSDVTHMVVSHIHCDHAGGLYLFPQAKFFVGPGEIEYGQNPNPESQHLVMDEDFLSEDVAGFDWTTVDTPRHDLFGDGAIELLHLPGHTPGQLAMLIRLPSRNVILSADVVHLREALTNRVAAPTDWDQEIAVRSIDRLAEIVAEENAHLWIAHDYRDWAEFGDPLTPLR